MLHVFIYVNDAKVHVHKTMFLQTLAVTEMSVRIPVRKLKGGNYISIEKRGCYKHVSQVLHILNNDITPTAYLHFESAEKFETERLA